MTTESQRYNCFTRNGANAIDKQSVPEAKSSNPATELACSGPVTHSGEISKTGKSHGKKPDRFTLNDDINVEKLLRFKYANCNIRGLGDKEEELDKILNENNIKISVITESKRNCKERKRLNAIPLFIVE